MSDSELQKEVKAIRKDLDSLMEKIDSIINKSKESDSNFREALKDSYQLFVAGVMGAVSGSLIGAYVAYPSFWFLVFVVASLALFSIFSGL